MSRESRSFVVQLEVKAPSANDEGLIGRVENLETGEWSRFRSGAALLRFLREALGEPDRRADDP
jgi:hypothetical protein